MRCIFCRVVLRQIERINFKNLVNKELSNEKLGKKRFEKITEKPDEKSNVKMGKSGGGGQYVIES
jgi:hypothetical protein